MIPFSPFASVRNEEAATYLATYKAFEHKPPDMLKERVHNDYASQLQNVLTSVKGVNKTNVMTLSTNFGVCPGNGVKTAFFLIR